MAKGSSFTSRELLIRIDERQQQICREIKEIKESLLKKVDLDEDYEEMKDRVSQLWDWKNRVLGWATAAGAIASIAYNLLEKVISVYAR